MSLFSTVLILLTTVQRKCESSERVLMYQQWLAGEAELLKQQKEDLQKKWVEHEQRQREKQGGGPAAPGAPGASGGGGGMLTCACASWLTCLVGFTVEQLANMLAT